MLTARRPRLVPLVCLLVVLASPPVRAGIKGLLLVPEVIPSPAHPLSLITPGPRRRLVHLADGEADLYRPRGFAAAPGVTVDMGKKAVIIDAKIAPRKLDYLDQIYPIEVIACWPHPKGKKAHETVVTIDAKPSDGPRRWKGWG